MSSVKVVLSTVKDGSMYNRHDMLDEKVITNRRKFLEQHAMAFETTTRVSTNLLERATITHDTNYLRFEYIGKEQAGDGINGKETIVADALATDQPGLAIMLPVADCVGAVFFDPAQSVLMVSHLGRHSLEQQGALRSVEYLTKHYGSTPENIQVWLTPAPSKESYQIWALDNKGMKEATFEQLTKAGIPKANITDDPRDTVTDANFYSYSEFLKGNRKEDGDHMIAAVIE